MTAARRRVLKGALTGARIELGQEVGRGGEGRVYVIQGRMDQVAKVYTAPPEERKCLKLVTMAKCAHPSLVKIAAWPIDPLKDGSGVIRGFTMPRVDARRDIHELYSPKSRSEAFPEVDFRFLVHVGANIARAFAVIHGQGHVVGDVNHGNLLVGSDGTVVLIDCDSFQISDGANVYTCDVGVPLFTAPELQGRGFRGLRRSADHDAFGLAVLLFHLLFMGRHPFAGRFSGSGEMPIERAIAEYRFAYGPDRTANRMEQPPGTIALESMGDLVAELFKRAFARGGSGRPEATQWIRGLEELKSQLLVCAAVSWHHYPRQLTACPWCKVENQTGARLFGLRIVPIGPIEAVDVGTLWKAIEAVPDPGPDPALPSDLAWQRCAGVQWRIGLRRVRVVVSVALAVIGCGSCLAGQFADPAEQAWIWVWWYACAGVAYPWWPWASKAKLTAAETGCAAARTAWQGAHGRWRQEASRDRFVKKLRELAGLREELEDLPNEYKRRMVELEEARVEKQQKRYLDRFRIDRAGIPMIGPSRTAMLASYGIETAADVDEERIRAIEGFGPALTEVLVSWRGEHEQNFHFNPKEPIDPRDLAALQHDLAGKRQQLAGALRSGSAELRTIGLQIVEARKRLAPILEKNWIAYKSAEDARSVL